MILTTLLSQARKLTYLSTSTEVLKVTDPTHFWKERDLHGLIMTDEGGAGFKEAAEALKTSPFLWEEESRSGGVGSPASGSPWTTSTKLKL